MIQDVFSSMIRKIIPPHVVYVRVGMNYFEIKILNKTKLIRNTSLQKFSNSRLLIADFPLASALLNKSLKRMLKIKTFSRTLIMVIQPVAILEGGLTNVERMVLTDIGGHAGAAEVHIDESEKELSEEQIKRILNR